eukprot:g3154.t1
MLDRYFGSTVSSPKNRNTDSSRKERTAIPPIATESSETLSEILAKPLKSCFGISDPLPIQQKALPLAREGKNVLCSAPTGTGKTLCYLLPIMERLATKEISAARSKRPRALIVVPTLPLASQVAKVAERLGADFGIRVLCVGQGAKVRPQRDGLLRGADIVVATPGRLLDLEKDGVFVSSDVLYVAIDEADIMLDEKTALGKEVRKLIGVACDISPEQAFRPGDGRFKHRHAKRGEKPAQLVMAAATVHDAQLDAFKATLPEFDICAAEGVLPGGLVHRHYWSDSKKKKGPGSKPHILLDVLRKHFARDAPSQSSEETIAEGRPSSVLSTREKVLIFCNKLESCLFVSHLLEEDERFASTSISLHGRLHPKDREDHLRMFNDEIEDSKKSILVCTDMAMRGLDFANVTNVIMFDFPYDATTYIHRVGRTGRAGSKGIVTSILKRSDKALFRAVASRHDASGTLGLVSGRRVSVQKKEAKSRRNVPQKKRTHRRPRANKRPLVFELNNRE